MRSEGIPLPGSHFQVGCIGKGKPHRPYGFHVKACLAVTHKEAFTVGIQSCTGNLFDDHVLNDRLDQVERLTDVVTRDVCGQWV